MKVALFVTGELELGGLQKALERRFPGHEHEYAVYQAGQRGQAEPFPSFTSSVFPTPRRSPPKIRS